MPAFDHLTPTATRARVAAALDDVLGIDAGASLLLADVLDSVSVAVCRTAGLTDQESREILARLWTDLGHPDPDLYVAAAALDEHQCRQVLGYLVGRAPAAVREALGR